MTKSTPDVSDSLSDEGIGGSFDDVWLFVASFAGNRVSLNFTSREISNHWWAASQNWIPVCNRRRSFLDSLGRVYVSSFLKCAPMLDNQRLVGVRYQVFYPTRVLLVFYSQVILLV